MMADTRITGRVIFEGTASGRVLKSDVPLGFFGHLDPETGIYKEQGHPLDGVSIKGRVLVFPRGKGSTVGSYILYGLKKAGNAPAALVMTECDTIVAVGALIGEIPTLDGVALSAFANDQLIRVQGGDVMLEWGPLEEDRMANKAIEPQDFRTQIPQSAFINAQVIQQAIRDENLGRSLTEISEHYKIPRWKLINPAHVASLMYCLIVVPKELWNPSSNDKIYALLEKSSPLSLFHISNWTPSANEHRLRDFLRHLRNTVAHVNFSVDDQQGFEFWDTNPKGVETFRAFISLDNLGKFLSTVGAELANLRSR